MTQLSCWYCDYCNPGREARDPEEVPPGLSEPGQGYAEQQGFDIPTGWWVVPGIGADGDDGHACPPCVLGPHLHEVVAARARKTEALVGAPSDGGHFGVHSDLSTRREESNMSPITGSQRDSQQPSEPPKPDPGQAVATSPAPPHEQPGQAARHLDEAVPEGDGAQAPEGDGEAEGGDE